MHGNFKMQSRSGDVGGGSISSTGLVATCCLGCTFSLAPLCRLSKARAAAACDRGLLYTETVVDLAGASEYADHALPVCMPRVVLVVVRLRSGAVMEKR